MRRSILMAMAMVWGLGLTVGTAVAATVTTADAVIDCSGTDLLQTAVSSVASSGTFTGEGSLVVTAFTNGQACTSTGSSPNYQSNRGTDAAKAENNTSVTYTLDGGYDLTQIDIYHGWQDDGRDRGQVTVKYAVVGDESTFLTIVTSQTYDPASSYGRIRLTDLGASNAKVVKFEFPAAQENNGAGYSEIDVFGTSAVPCTGFACGGTETDVGGYRIHTFTGSGTLNVTGNGNVEVLVIGGGGGGGGSTGGGGGAGGSVYNGSYAVSPGSYTVTIGAGGAGGISNVGANGGNSVFGTLTAIGGGAGGANAGTDEGQNGGSGGGASYVGGFGIAGLGTPGQGNDGGVATFWASPYPAGGGGGAGSVGSNGSATTLGHGGAGLSSDISGTTTWYAGGGGGGNYNGNGGNGGNGGGGQGAGNALATAGNGVAGTGGGGGGMGQNRGTQAGSGGSGIVIVRYSIAPDTTAPVLSSTIPVNGVGSVSPSANLVATFDEDVALKAGGTITIMDLDDGTGNRTITLLDGQVTVSAANVTIDPTADLEFGTTYAIQISADALEDTAATPNVYGGISDTTTWSFTTVGATVAPTVTLGGGATNTGVGTATLRGELTAGDIASAYICWGTTDGGTSGTGAWENVVPMGIVTNGVPLSTNLSGAYYGHDYKYRVYAVNDMGSDWSGLDTFETVEPPAGYTESTGWTYAAWTADDDSGITDARTYTAAHSFGDNHAGITIEGVPFTYTFGASGTGWSIGGARSNWGGDDNAELTGVSEDLGEEFVYNGNPRTVQMSGLTNGTRYRATFYSVGWEASGRTQTFSSGGNDLVLDQDFYGNNKGITISYVYDATAATQDFSITPTGGTFHMYGLSNRDVELLVTKSIANTAATNIGQTTADLEGTLTARESVYNVTVYWSTNNNADSAAWLADGSAQSQAVAAFTNVIDEPLSDGVTGLTSGTTYYYTYRATTPNGARDIWASANKTFTTLAAPVVTHNGGVTNLAATSATLRGILTAGGVATATIVWGDDIPTSPDVIGNWDDSAVIGSVSQGVPFSHDAAGLARGTTHYYRCHITNAVDEAWSTVESFTTLDAFTWDANGATAGQTDGGGTWLTANMWWDGSTNQTWATTDALIGSGGNGGTITLGTVSAEAVDFGSFNGTYRLNSGTLAQTGGISDSASSSTVQIDSLISGTGGITKTGANLFIITNNSNAYTGATVVNGGILQFGTGWPNSWASGSLPTTTNLEINDGTVAVWYYSSRNLGTGPGEIQLTGGTCGFAMRQGDAGGVGWTVNGSSAYEVVWGIPTFNPSVLLLSDAAAGSNRAWRFVNKVDLNGADRTVSVTSTSHNGQMEGVIRNSSGTEAGITKIGAGTLVLTATNTYDGDTTVNGGTLQLNGVNSSNENSTVTIAAGAKLTLNHSGSDTVYTAFIGGTQRDAGEYGHTNSGATNGGLGVGALDAYFGTGSGKLITTADIVAPTLASSDFVDNKSGGPVAVGVVTTYTVTFSEDMDAATVTTADFGNAGTATVTIDSVTETSPGVFSVVVTPTGDGSLQLRVNALATLTDVAGNALDTAAAIADDTSITVQPTDTTPPTLASSDIVDDKTGGPVGVGALVTYTVSFNEDMDAATVTGTDFSNFGSAGVTIGAVTETGANTGVFTVAVTTTGTGTLRLQVNQSASLLDVAGNALDTAAAILDATTLTVENTPPTLASSDIVDDQAGGPVTIGTLITYTVTFSENMDDSTVSAADFGNNGTASISFGTVTETAAGVFSVQVTPTSDGTIELQVNAAADLRDVAGNALNTAAAIVDNTSITVTIPTFTWDANAATAGQTDGGGTWLNANQWWDGASNQTWADSANAIIGNGGNGGTLTLGTISLGTLTLDNFNGTYTLNSGSLAQSGGISLGATATNARINSEITGAGGITKGNPGLLILTRTSNAYTGATIVSDGVLQLGTGWSNAGSIPGGISTAGATTGSNLEINGGTVTLCYYLRRTLGAGPGELQITGGHSGFNHWQSDTYGRININNNSNFELVWGSAFFKPDALVLNEDAATPQQVVNIQNKIDLNGATRTVACNSTRVLGSSVNNSNGNMPTAGGRLTNVIRNSGGTAAGITKIGAGTLQLTAVNTFDGDTTVVAGTLWLKTINASNENSTVTIAAGATVNLDFAGTDTVAKLFVGGLQVKPGEYGHTTSGATNGTLGLGALDAYFEASAGKLNVTQGPPGTVIRIR